MRRMLLVSGVILVLYAGCGSEPPPPTPQEIQSFTEAQFTGAYIDVQSTGKHIPFIQANDPTFKSILKTLLPIESSEIGKLSSFEYSLLCYQGAKPTVIWVKVDDEKLEYCIGNGIYRGGNAEDFVRIINNRLAQLEMSPSISLR